MLARHGIPEIENGRDSTGVLETQIWPLVTDASIFGYHSRSLMRGEWTARVDGDAIALTPTSLYLELSEFRINRFNEEDEEGPMLRPDLDAIFDEALTAARGYSWQELLTLMERHHHRREALPPAEHAGDGHVANAGPAG